jgi:hypothetical protein
MGFIEAKIQAVEDIYRLIWTAVASKQPIEGRYRGRDGCLAPRDWAGIMRDLSYLRQQFPNEDLASSRSPWEEGLAVAPAARSGSQRSNISQQECAVRQPGSRLGCPGISRPPHERGGRDSQPRAGLSV